MNFQLNNVNIPVGVSGINLNYELIIPFTFTGVSGFVGPNNVATFTSGLAEIRARSGVEFSLPPYCSIAPGTEAIAVAVRTHAGEAVGAISLSGEDLGPELSVDSRVTAQLRRVAESVGSALR